MKKKHVTSPEWENRCLRAIEQNREAVARIDILDESNKHLSFMLSRAFIVASISIVANIALAVALIARGYA